MAITLVPMICPQCHATIEAPVDKDSCFCTHCGTRILINNDNVKTININRRFRTRDSRHPNRLGTLRRSQVGW